VQQDEGENADAADAVERPRQHALSAAVAECRREIGHRFAGAVGGFWAIS
jgi:hypothetical protein